LLCSNILPSILGHDISGKKSLVRDPTCFQTYEPPSLFQGAMSKVDTMRSVVIIQVMQNAESYDDIRVSKSRVVPKRVRVADYESSLASVPPFGGSDTSTIDIEPEVIDVWKPR
jgi:hypothetical protein